MTKRTLDDEPTITAAQGAVLGRYRYACERVTRPGPADYLAEVNDRLRRARATLEPAQLALLNLIIGGRTIASLSQATGRKPADLGQMLAGALDALGAYYEGVANEDHPR